MRTVLYGAMTGDIAGSWYEFHNVRTEDPTEIHLCRPMNRYTDDTVCTFAIAEALMNPKEDGTFDFTKYLQKWVRNNPKRGYGKMFYKWAISDNPQPYNSWGNGSAMRVSPVAYYAKSLEECLELAKQSAECTHNHPEGIKGAQAIAECTYLAIHKKEAKTLNGQKKFIKESLVKYYPEYENKTLADIRPTYTHFDCSCQGSVPVAIVAFLESISYEDCLRKVISLGGDTDTTAAMAGSIAYPFYNYYMSEPVIDQTIGKTSFEMMVLNKEFTEYVQSNRSN